MHIMLAHCLLWMVVIIATTESPELFNVQTKVFHNAVGCSVEEYIKSSNIHKKKKCHCQLVWRSWSVCLLKA